MINICVNHKKGLNDDVCARLALVAVASLQELTRAHRTVHAVAAANAAPVCAMLLQCTDDSYILHFAAIVLYHLCMESNLADGSSVNYAHDDDDVEQDAGVVTTSFPLGAQTRVDSHRAKRIYFVVHLEWFFAFHGG